MKHFDGCALKTVWLLCSYYIVSVQSSVGHRGGWGSVPDQSLWNL